MKTELLLGDCLERLKELPDNSVDSIVTDPPYGLGKEPDALKMLTDWIETGHHDVKGRGFMGKEWDAFVPQPQVWHECLRVLKPGGHLLAFAGTRTQDLMTLGLRLAGFEIRDMIGWVYGCLSEDTEILIDGRWEPYHKAIDKGRALCYIPEHDRYEWQPIQDFIEYDYDDTAFRIVSDRTDQIVSRNHRCLVERGGKYVFRYAETLERQETIPVLEGLPELLRDLPLPHEGAGEQKSVLRQGVCAEESRQGQIAIGAQGTNGDVLDLRQRNMEAGCVAKENQSDVLLAQMQWGSEGEGVGESCLQGPGCVDGGERVGISGEYERREESSMEGGSDLLQAQGQICEPEDQVCEMPAGVCEHGTQGWVCDGAPLERSEGNRASVDADGVRASCEPRCDGQPTGKPDAICDELRPQEIRASRHTRPDLARVERIHYKGKVWCVRVPSGAFVARRNGKIFVTGNSGFPKSANVSKHLDKMAGAEREVVGKLTNARPNSHGKNEIPVGSAGLANGSGLLTAPTTEAAKQWEGFGTALKPSLEPLTLARKPLEGTVAANVLKWHTGALNIDGCRVSGEAVKICNYESTGAQGCITHTGVAGHSGREYSERMETKGRWPANLIHDGSEEVVDLFPKTTSGKPGTIRKGTNDGAAYGAESRAPGTPMTGFGDSGSAARFFYCAKTSKTDRNEGLEDAPDAVLARSCQAIAEAKRGKTVETEGGAFNKARVVKNNHPTVKPADLMRYLCRLVTPPGGVILDPYMGSGSTGKAAIREGFRFIGIERDPDYFKIAEARIAAAREAALAQLAQEVDAL